MSTHHRTFQVPRARLDTIGDEPTAIRLLHATLAIPPRPETVVLVLDDAHCGLGVITVTDTTDPEQVITVAETLARPELFDGEAAALIIATARPGGGYENGDVERWMELHTIVEDAGLEFLEWFVVGREIMCPRDLLGAPPRWRGGVARSA